VRDHMNNQHYQIVVDRIDATDFEERRKNMINP